MDPNAIKDGLEQITSQFKSRTSSNPDVAKFFEMLSKVTSKAHNEDDCPEGDCDDLLSECCSSPMTTVFGTIPLLVKCVTCDKTYVLRNLLDVQKTS